MKFPEKKLDFYSKAKLRKKISDKYKIEEIKKDIRYLIKKKEELVELDKLLGYQIINLKLKLRGLGEKFYF